MNATRSVTIQAILSRIAPVTLDSVHEAEDEYKTFVFKERAQDAQLFLNKKAPA
jgi:hypothetical protein